MSRELLVSASKLDLNRANQSSGAAELRAESRGKPSCRRELQRIHDLVPKYGAMELTIKGFPMKIVNIPWRNNNLSTLHTEPPLSEQGETFIGIYLIVLGKSDVV